MIQMQDVMSKPMPNFREGSIIKGQILEVRPREVLVDVGYKSEGVIPLSEFEDPESLQIGDEVDVLLERLENEQGMVVLSKEKAACRQHWNKIVTVFGGFIDLEGIDGLLHVTDMTWGRLGHPSELLKVGQQLEVVVLDINKEKERVSLGLKQTQNNPWDQIEERFPAGQRIKGKITNLVPYGAFVEIEEGVEGLIHVSELSWTKRIMRPSDILSVGQEVEAVVLGVNKEEQKISLGLRQLEPNPWDEIEKKFTIGSRVKGKIRNMTAYGAFVELDEGIDGLIHVSDLSWTKKINQPSEVLKKSDEIKEIVIDIDKVNQRISLGIKQMS